jgi:hypothetical protein
LQQVKHVQANQHRNVQFEPRIGWLDMNVETPPEVFPSKNMVLHRGIETTRARDRLTRLTPRLRNGVIARGAERYQLLQRQRPALLNVDFQFLADVARLLDDPARDIENLSVKERSRSRHLRDVNI